MRIVLDMQSLQSTSRVRGIGRYSLALTRHLAGLATEHEIIVAVNGALPEMVDAVCADLDGIVPKERLVTWSQPGKVGFVSGNSRWRQRAAERLRERFLESLQPDIVHVSSLFEGVVEDITTSIAEVPVRYPTAVTLYDLIPLTRKDIYLSNPQVADWYERKLASLRRADLWLAISDYTRREGIRLLGLPEEQVHSISSAADPMFRPLRPANEMALLRRYGLDRPFIMYTTTYEPRKNLDGLFEAYAGLSPELRGRHKLAIVCRIDDHDLVRLRAGAARAGLRDEDYVVTGYVPDEDLIALYSLCRLYVFPSLDEGFGLPVLEAMACGAPVLASGTSSLPEVVGRQDALFDPSSPADMTRLISKALLDEGFLGDLSAHGLDRARQFNWDKVAGKALEAFETLHERQQVRSALTVREPTRRRPRLALVGPLMPVSNRYSKHASRLLPDLARHYDIECIVRQDLVEDPFARANLPLRSEAWFADNGARYDRVLYQMGADPALDAATLELLKIWPGTVVLHGDDPDGAPAASGSGASGSDKELSELWIDDLYRSRGWKAVVDRLRSGTLGSASRPYPFLGSIERHAAGVILLDDGDGKAGRIDDPGAVRIDSSIAPVRIAELYREAIEGHAEGSRMAGLDRLMDDIQAIASPDEPTQNDWEEALICAAENLPPESETRQLMLDVSVLVHHDAGTGIQRVTRNITLNLLQNPPAGYRVEPVFDNGDGVFLYARSLAARMIGLTATGLRNDPIDTKRGDILLGLDLASHQIIGRRDINRKLRQRGVDVVYVVYDILPVQRPDWFNPVPRMHFQNWLQIIVAEADGLICISRSVARQLLSHLPTMTVDRLAPLKIGHFHLGGDLSEEAGTASERVRSLLNKPALTFLVVGTIEPRKGHAQCLDAFEELWAAGRDIELVVVGKEGWLVEDLAQRMRRHPEGGKRFHWLENASDADLAALYESCAALLVMSQDEGFGLPLIEAAKHGQPIIARDVPVFREIAGDHAFYFAGTSGRDFAEALIRWIDLRQQGSAPDTSAMPWLTWEGSASQLMDVVIHGRWDATWRPGKSTEVSDILEARLETVEEAMR